ncbi:zinc-ribbon domain-containing protein [Roseibium suaedae]|uniref:MJ0042 family finger-like domain-containing protein n=1 Tax=Roseibium suaedae TaxID=735517 RepID=A0A1M7MSG3_9HYPH|nr:zinc-ribbon domain-containing protein [Roseibium suaedae]SHM94043.1 MJ0042 family finger-like domain-containing protein [Roseibium suaedae]
MKIKCPDCSTSYDIKAEALGPEGRSVKCARCGNRWFVSPKQEEDEDLQIDQDEAAWTQDEQEEAEAQSAASDDADDYGGRDDTIDDDEDDEEEDEAPAAPRRAAKVETSTSQAAPAKSEEPSERPTDIESQAKRPKIIVNPNKFKRNRIAAIFNWIIRRNFRRIGGITLFVGAIGVCSVAVLFRDAIVKQAPDLASLFETIGMEVNLRGLEFRDLRTFHELDAGNSVLVVEGSIRNITENSTPVPAVRLSIRGSDLQEIYAWTVEPRTKMLKALDETRFRTILSDPPSGATDIQVRFIDRGQRQAVLE